MQGFKYLHCDGKLKLSSFLKFLHPVLFEFEPDFRHLNNKVLNTRQLKFRYRFECLQGTLKLELHPKLIQIKEEAFLYKDYSKFKIHF